MPKKTIRPDRVQANDIKNLNIIYACEDCIYFKAKGPSCVLGLSTEPHLRLNQLKKFNLSGQMLFCRFLEIG